MLNEVLNDAQNWEGPTPKDLLRTAFNPFATCCINVTRIRIRRRIYVVSTQSVDLHPSNVGATCSKRNIWVLRSRSFPVLRIVQYLVCMAARDIKGLIYLEARACFSVHSGIHFKAVRNESFGVGPSQFCASFNTSLMSQSEIRLHFQANSES